MTRTIKECDSLLRIIFFKSFAVKKIALIYQQIFASGEAGILSDGVNDMLASRKVLKTVFTTSLIRLSSEILSPWISSISKLNSVLHVCIHVTCRVDGEERLIRIFHFRHDLLAVCYANSMMELLMWVFDGHVVSSHVERKQTWTEIPVSHRVNQTRKKLWQCAFFPWNMISVKDVFNVFYHGWESGSVCRKMIKYRKTKAQQKR